MRLPCISWWWSTEKVSYHRSSVDYVMFGVLWSPLHSSRTNVMCPHWGLQNVSNCWLSFEFVVFLCGTYTLTCIPGTVHLRMSRRTSIWKMKFQSYLTPDILDFESHNCSFHSSPTPIQVIPQYVPFLLFPHNYSTTLVDIDPFKKENKPFWDHGLIIP